MTSVPFFSTFVSELSVAAFAVGVRAVKPVTSSYSRAKNNTNLFFI